MPTARNPVHTKATGVIADRPSDLNSQLVRLTIHEWDEQRRIKRRAAVKSLDVTTIEGVLRHLAFRLTMDGSALFDERDLSEILDELGDHFELGTSNARRFIRELQAHAGFVAETP